MLVKGGWWDGSTWREKNTPEARQLVRLQLQDGGRQEGDLVAFSIVALMFPRLSEQTEQAGFSPSHPVIYC